VKAKEINKKKKEGKKMLPGDFTVSEGHGHPLVQSKNESSSSGAAASKI
jgi:uncharacterized protein YktB (UPF0637 family)